MSEKNRRSQKRRQENREQKNKAYLDSVRSWWTNLMDKLKKRPIDDLNEKEAKTFTKRTERKNAQKKIDEKAAMSERDERGVEDEIEISIFKSWWMRLILIAGSGFILALIGYTTILFGGRLIVDDEKLIISPPTTIETAEGEIIWYLYDEFRLPVKLDDIPEHVQDAFIAIEDRRFYSHTGVDLRSIARAVYRDILARDKVEGASTITQQLAKNLFLTNDKSWWRKIKEAMIALHLEREYTKDQLLEIYLNVIYFGQGQYGVEAASNRFFHKSVDELTLEEGALLAGIIKAPNGYSPIDHPEKAIERRNVVLKAMEELDYISKEEMVAASDTGLELNISVRKTNQAHHTIADLAIKEAEELYGISLAELKEKRYRIVTAMDPEVQEIVYDQFQYDGYFPGNDKETVEGAFVMLDQKTGQIIAAQGGRDYIRGNLNRVVERRQPGSTLKPLAVFAPALESGEFGPYSMLPDELREWDGHEVRNYDNSYEGSVSLYDSVRRSKNTSTYWLLNEIGVSYSKKFLSSMFMDIEDNGLSIALGGLEKGVSPLQMAQAYRTFVHSGEAITAHTVLEIYNNENKIIASAQPETEQVFSEQVAWDMTEMLKDVVKNGTAQSGSYPYELAGKTGTTQHALVEGESRDAWFVGFTPEYVTSLWIGYDVSDKDHYLTGGSAYPTQLTKAILSDVARSKDVVQTFIKPEGVSALAAPMELPVITDLVGSYTFGGLKVLKGKLQWTGSNDNRVVYRIYEQHEDDVSLIAEVTGDEEYVIDEFMLFKKRSYYVIPYDPITEEEGEKSNLISLP